jgi:hypothetical protein
MKTLQRAAYAMLWAALVGSITLGIGARLVMRLLALRKDLQPVFSFAAPWRSSPLAESSARQRRWLC